ncbi:nucleoside diphosphate kinase [Linderina pennispora]|uniref:Nucleoside diphosphate kinase n=1 Tax=Linderina pennispora TaxID=61395 RepID=A0A1Y1W8W3_9FUNG|nr:nucleoside diphosphate kinase [Linderina pennispora]ORX69892.1 nucleoside diphosphate kinase [Linderina pennispora]
MSCAIRTLSTKAVSAQPQLTLALLKPDLLANPSAVQQIIHEISANPALSIIHQKTDFWTTARATQFYSEHQGRFFFGRLVGYMTSGPILAMALRGPHAIADWRAMLGLTHPVRMRLAQPASLRARFGLTDTRNSFHGSDSMQSAERELRFVFGDAMVDQWLGSVRK